MLRPTDPKLEELMFLRDAVIPWMRDNPERVDFDEFNSECGTYGCLLGWYCVMRHEQDVINLVRSTGGDVISSCFGDEALEDWGSLFGNSEYGTLEDRAEVLDRIIAEKVGALG